VRTSVVPSDSLSHFYVPHPTQAGYLSTHSCLRARLDAPEGPGLVRRASCLHTRFYSIKKISTSVYHLCRGETDCNEQWVDDILLADSFVPTHQAKPDRAEQSSLDIDARDTQQWLRLIRPHLMQQVKNTDLPASSPRVRSNKHLTLAKLCHFCLSLESYTRFYSFVTQ